MNKIGALCSDDYKGINNQYVDQGKVIICCMRNTNLVGGENALKPHQYAIPEDFVGGVRKYRDRQNRAALCG